MTDESRAIAPAQETVGELVERLGESEAYLHIVVYNIRLRAAMSDLLDAVEADFSPHYSRGRRTVDAITEARRALDA